MPQLPSSSCTAAAAALAEEFTFRALLAICHLMLRVDVPQLVGEFLDSLRTYIGSGEVDLSAGLTLSKKSLDGMGAPLALLLEHRAIVKAGPTSYKLPKPLVSHLRAECRVHGRIDGPRSLPTALDLAELCQQLVQSGKAVLEPGTVFKGVAPNQHRQLRRLHPVPAARVIAPTLPPACEADVLLHDWAAAEAVGLEREKRAAAGAEGVAAEAEGLPSPATDYSVIDEKQRAALFDDGSISSLITSEPVSESEQPIKKSKSRPEAPKKCNCKNAECLNATEPMLGPEQPQQRRQQQQQLLAQRLEALSAALDVGALSPALYEQARRELGQ